MLRGSFAPFELTDASFSWRRLWAYVLSFRVERFVIGILREILGCIFARSVKNEELDREVRRGAYLREVRYSSVLPPAHARLRLYNRGEGEQEHGEFHACVVTKATRIYRGNPLVRELGG